MQKLSEELIAYISKCSPVRQRYYALMRELCFAGARAPQPFSLCVSRCEVPLLSDDEDRVARARASRLALVFIKRREDSIYDLKDCASFLSYFWSNARGEVRETTPDMLARTFYYTAEHLEIDTPLQSIHQEELKRYWQKNWAFYDGQQVDQHTLELWRQYVQLVEKKRCAGIFQFVYAWFLRRNHKHLKQLERDRNPSEKGDV